MKIKTKHILIACGLIGGYLLYKYFTPKKIAETVTNAGINYIAALPSQLYERDKILFIPYKKQVTGAEQTEQLVNIAALITRYNPITKPISPILDWVLNKTSETLGGL